MALPKWKKSKSRSRMRKAKFYGGLELPNLVKCPNCGAYKEPHRICYKCGFYKDKIIIDTKFRKE